MQDKLTKYINTNLLTNSFFCKLDKVAKYTGEEILLKYDRFNLKNESIEKVQDISDYNLYKYNDTIKKIFPNKKLNIKARFTEVKSISISNSNACAPFDFVYISIPLVNEWWKKENSLKYKYFKCCISINQKLSKNFIELDDINGHWLDSINWLDKIALYKYLNTCLNAFSS